MKKMSRARNGLIFSIAAVLAAGFLFPLFMAFMLSLKSMKEAYADPPTLLPGEAHPENYVEVMEKLPFGQFLLNSLLIAVPASCGATLTSAMAGYVFARGRWRSRRFWAALLVLTLVVPTPVLLVPRFLMFNSLGWMNTYKPLIVPAWLGGGAFNVLLFREFFRRMGTHLEDAARLDGATPWEVFWQVHLPSARPVVAAVAIMSFVYHWNLFLEPLMYLSDFRTFPVAVGLRMYQTLSGTWLPQLMAASLIALAPVLFAVTLLTRWVWPRSRQAYPMVNIIKSHVPP